MTKQEALDYLDEQLEKALRIEALEAISAYGSHDRPSEAQIQEWMEKKRQARHEYWQGLEAGTTFKNNRNYRLDNKVREDDEPDSEADKKSNNELPSHSLQ
jgi:hypothetical protein